MSGPARYRLQALLELREREEGAAKEDLAAAVREVEAAAGRLAELERALAQQRARRESVGEAFRLRLEREGAEARALQGQAAYEQRLRAEEARAAAAVEAQGVALGEAEALVAARRESLAGAVKATRVLAKHREAWAAALQRERERREELVLDELGQRGPGGAGAAARPGR